MDLSLDGRYIRHASVVKRTIAGQSILIPMGPAGADLQMVFTLNTTAEAVWELLSEEKTADDIVNALLSDYEADPDCIRQDIEDLLGILISRGLVTESAHHE